VKRSLARKLVSTSRREQTYKPELVTYEPSAGVAVMSDRLDRDRPAIQLTTSNNENKANRLHPFFTEYVRMVEGL
jgi:hypothetical protein